MPSFCLLVLALLAQTDAPERTDPDHQWPAWRGPRATGDAPHATPPLEWSEEHNVRWTAEIPGAGKSTPIVWGDQVFILTAQPTGRSAEANTLAQRKTWDDAKTENPTEVHEFVLLSYERDTGELRWKAVAETSLPVEGHHPTNGFASSSPVTDGERLYAFFGSHGLYCFDLEGGLLWRREFPPQHTRKGWGEGASAALSGDVLVVPYDHEGASFATALDAADGEPLWKVDRDEPTTWATPLIVEHGGVEQAILQGTTRVRSYALRTGELLWECGGQTVNAIPSPVHRGGVVYCLSGYRGQACFALALDGRGDLSGTEFVRWELHRGTPYVPSPLLVKDRLYFSSSMSPLLSCANSEDGSLHYDRERLPELDRLYASPIHAAGRIYIAGRGGATVVLREGPELEVLAINSLDSPLDASPAAAGDQLFLRGDSKLYCIQEGAD